MNKKLKETKIMKANPQFESKVRKKNGKISLSIPSLRSKQVLGKYERQEFMLHFDETTDSEESTFYLYVISKYVTILSFPKFDEVRLFFLQ